ncbi:hypothetical protein PVAP13_2NG632900 [Panicum virgatum]|nr:hypothetical protein PVAP13_2NG632900 [Panicum virgatum]
MGAAVRATSTGVPGCCSSARCFGPAATVAPMSLTVRWCAEERRNEDARGEVEHEPTAIAAPEEASSHLLPAHPHLGDREALPSFYHGLGRLVLRIAARRVAVACKSAPPAAGASSAGVRASSAGGADLARRVGSASCRGVLPGAWASSQVRGADRVCELRQLRTSSPCCKERRPCRARRAGKLLRRRGALPSWRVR